MIYSKVDRHNHWELAKAIAVVLTFTICVLAHVVNWFTPPRYESAIFDTSSYTMF